MSGRPAAPPWRSPATARQTVTRWRTGELGAETDASGPVLDGGRIRKLQQIDALAASLMLQNYLDSRMHRRRRREDPRQNATS